jgi:hypothetical protein
MTGRDRITEPALAGGEPTVRLLSLGAGVQSTTLALLAVHGHLPGLDGAIFADTGWEPAQVYAQLERISRLLAGAGIPLYRVSRGNLREDAINPGHRFVSVPYFVRHPDGSEGMGRRQCTAEYKLAPISRKVRQLLGAAPPDYRRVPRGQVAEQWIGFSTDEISRINNHHGTRYERKRYPLLELDMSRTDCTRFLRRHGWGDTAKNAYIGCPFHGNQQWRELRDQHPDEGPTPSRSTTPSAPAAPVPCHPTARRSCTVPDSHSPKHPSTGEPAPNGHNYKTTCSTRPRTATPTDARHTAAVPDRPR